jgi:hypothetical protein
MSKTSTESKKKWNKANYKRYEFNVGLDKKLNYCLEEYMKENSVSELIKTLLAEHFGISADENYFPYHYDKDGNLIADILNDSGIDKLAEEIYGEVYGISPH